MAAFNRASWHRHPTHVHQKNGIPLRRGGPERPSPPPGSFGRLSTRIRTRAAAFSRSYSPFIVRVNDREPAECRGYFNRLAALITIIRHAVAEAPAWVTVCGLKRDTPHLGHADTTCCALTSMYFKSRANTTGRNDDSTGDDDRSMDWTNANFPRIQGRWYCLSDASLLLSDLNQKISNDRSTSQMTERQRQETVQLFFETLANKGTYPTFFSF